MNKSNKNTNRGSIGITIVMLVFGFLMSVSMAYHKSVQTETLIQNISDQSDRAMDAAFSGVNYAMALLQSHKEIFKSDQNKVLICNSDTSDEKYTSNWIIATDSYKLYLDEDRESTKKTYPPYRFKVACNTNSYFKDSEENQKVLIKSYGEYIKYEGTTIVASYGAQIMAECLISKTTRTIKLERYRRMQVQVENNDNSFYSFSRDFNQDK